MVIAAVLLMQHLMRERHPNRSLGDGGRDALDVARPDVADGGADGLEQIRGRSAASAPPPDRRARDRGPS